MQRTSRKQLPRRGGVLVVPLGADVAGEDDLSNLLAILGYVFQHPLGPIRLDDADRQTYHKAMALSSHPHEPVGTRECVPRR